MTQMIKQGEVVSFDEDKRILRLRVLPWNKAARTSRGWESFDPAFFDALDPSAFVLRQRHQDPPAGRGISKDKDENYLYLDTKVARTPTGDDIVSLYQEGVETGVSIGFEDGPGIKRGRGDDGVATLLHRDVKPDGMLEVSTTYIPAFGQESAVVQYMEKESVTEEAQTPTATAEATAPAPVVTFDKSILKDIEDRLVARIDRLEEKQAAAFLNAPSTDPKGQLKAVVKLQIRELADVTTAGNEAVVPDAIVNTMLGRIQAGRPFLENTLRVPLPEAGLNLVYPKLTQTPLVGEQESEKGELPSRATTMTTVEFPFRTIGGAGDLSMQLIKRSSPSFLQLWLDLLGDAYAIDADDKAVDALLAEAAVIEGGAFDPESPSFGGAFTNAATATGRTMAPDRIFLSTPALAAFIDAKEPAGGGGRPLYSGLVSIGGIGDNGDSLPGSFTLRAVWVPALDDEAVDMIVGPSRAFAWTEDGTYTLQADVPSKFGRDVGIAGMIAFAPLYPAAFTSYTI